MSKLLNRLQACGTCCGIFSFFAIIFLIIVGEVMASNTRVVKVSPEDRAEFAKSCRLAAAIYAGTLFLSLLCYGYSYHGKKKAQELAASIEAVNSALSQAGRAEHQRPFLDTSTSAGQRSPPPRPLDVDLTGDESKRVGSYASPRNVELATMSE